jgi:hypothetical protein
MQANKFLSILCACLLFLLSGEVEAQVTGFTVLNVKGRVQIEIPNDWMINDAEQRKRVKEFAEKLSGYTAHYTASLAAQSYPTPSRTMVRVSFIPMDPPITQADVLQEVRANKQQVLTDLKESWRKESLIMWDGLAKSGIREVGRPRFAIENIGGQTALVISYGRTSVANPAETMRVTQYHVLLGSEKALITLSHIEGDPRATSSHNRLKSSIIIR